VPGPAACPPAVPRPLADLPPPPPAPPTRTAGRGGPRSVSSGNRLTVEPDLIVQHPPRDVQPWPAEVRPLDHRRSSHPPAGQPTAACGEKAAGPRDPLSRRVVSGLTGVARRRDHRWADGPQPVPGTPAAEPAAPGGPTRPAGHRTFHQLPDPATNPAAGAHLPRNRRRRSSRRDAGSWAEDRTAPRRPTVGRSASGRRELHDAMSSADMASGWGRASDGRSWAALRPPCSIVLMATSKESHDSCRRSPRSGPVVLLEIWTT